MGCILFLGISGLWQGSCWMHSPPVMIKIILWHMSVFARVCGGCIRFLWIVIVSVDDDLMMVHSPLKHPHGCCHLLTSFMWITSHVLSKKTNPIFVGCTRIVCFIAIPNLLYCLSPFPLRLLVESLCFLVVTHVSSLGWCSDLCWLSTPHVCEWATQ